MLCVVITLKSGSKAELKGCLKGVKEMCMFFSLCVLGMY